MLLNEITDNETEHRRALNQTGFWGRQGAGCVFLAQDTGRLCLAHRSSAVEQPGTWGTWGGAIDTGEDPQEAVQREVREEAGYRGPIQLIPLMRFEHASGFRYHNFLALVPEEFQPQLNWESSGFAWFEPDQWPSPLHPGVAQLIRDAASRRTIDRYSAAARGGRELDEARVYLRPGQLRGSYRDQQLRDMGFQQDQRGAWWIDRARWEELIRTGRLQENFADGRKPGRRGLAKRSGVNCKQSVSQLRSIAKHSSGERQRMAHWCANMKSGRKKDK